MNYCLAINSRSTLLVLIFNACLSKTSIHLFAHCSLYLKQMNKQYTLTFDLYVGKGESIWDKFSHDRGGDNGENTCDGFYRYKEDVAYLKKMQVC